MPASIAPFATWGQPHRAHAPQRGAARDSCYLSVLIERGADRADTNREIPETMRWMIITLVAIGALLFLLNQVVTHLFN
jgi:hypothetical protein